MPYWNLDFDINQFQKLIKGVGIVSLITTVLSSQSGIFNKEYKGIIVFYQMRC